ncbi:hypothetical protein ACFPT7_09300 [Acidicapsa dinghuensis]|uniref:Copper resistance protein CopC n=1 Tax=Acidicapsa dinghuensis TaxID=2218256 RepID=A0ABW1EHL6_9BACT|nr:hypothetical protein [Acidicapsa dinghuensis]
MNRPRRFVFYIALTLLIADFAGVAISLHSQNPSDFPPGFDALQAAPNSHKLLFENEFVRVLQVDLPRSGVIPMHHHRWPSLAIDWDTGGDSAHIRYLRPGQPAKDIPAVEAVAHKGVWEIHWMKPEPMHSIEVVSPPKDEMEHASDPPELRIEIKVGQ